MKTSDLEMALGELALPLERGDTAREICPKCGGGQSREKSLGIGVSEEGYLWWKCHRASCGFAGRRLAWGVVGSHPPKKTSVAPFTGLLEHLSETQRALFEETYGFLVPDNWRFAPEYSKLYIPTLGPKFEHRGCILRNLPGGERHPKTLTFKEVGHDTVWMGWYNSRNNLHAHVVVEDSISAAKLASIGLPSIALLGTHMGLDKVREILTKTDTICLALDKDAIAKAMNYAILYKELLDIRVWSLDKDLKYVDKDRIMGAYFERKENFGRSDQRSQSL